MSVSETILALATKRGRHKTICPSEVARQLWPHNWQPHMEEVRSEAYRLRKEGKVSILQKGIAITDGEATGPIRISIA